jgi:hypothetical protein
MGVTAKPQRGELSLTTQPPAGLDQRPRMVGQPVQADSASPAERTPRPRKSARKASPTREG